MRAAFELQVLESSRTHIKKKNTSRRRIRLREPDLPNRKLKKDALGLFFFPPVCMATGNAGHCGLRYKRLQTPPLDGKTRKERKFVNKNKKKYSFERSVRKPVCAGFRGDSAPSLVALFPFANSTILEYA